MEVMMTLSTQMGELVAVFPGSSLHGSKRFCHHTGRRGRGNLRNLMNLMAVMLYPCTTRLHSVAPCYTMLHHVIRCRDSTSTL